MKIIWLVAIALVLSTASAQFSGICGDLFKSDASQNLPYGGMLAISVIMVLMVLSIMGIVYAFGVGFGIDSLKTFVRTEFLESVFNLVLIVFVASGLAFAGGAISFLASIGGVAFQQTTSSCGSPTITSAYDAYFSICDCYVGKGITSVIPYVISTSVSLSLINSFKSILIRAEPTEFGFEGALFSGLEPVATLTDLQLDFFILMIGFFISVPVLLWLIYGLFPWFLYVGIALRSVPWTRSAGGSFLALFIAFYIVFPALLFPFTTYSLTGVFCPPGSNSINSGVCQSMSPSIWSITSFAAGSIISVIFTFFGGTYIELVSFASVASVLAVQLLGLVISLLISLDLVEVLGDVLGAPSLHTKKLLSKVI